MSDQELRGPTGKTLPSGFIDDAPALPVIKRPTRRTTRRNLTASAAETSAATASAETSAAAAANKSNEATSAPITDINSTTSSAHGPTPSELMNNGSLSQLSEGHTPVSSASVITAGTEINEKNGSLSPSLSHTISREKTEKVGENDSCNSNTTRGPQGNDEYSQF